MTFKIKQKKVKAKKWIGLHNLYDELREAKFYAGIENKKVKTIKEKIKKLEGKRK